MDITGIDMSFPTADVSIEPIAVFVDVAIAIVAEAITIVILADESMTILSIVKGETRGRVEGGREGRGGTRTEKGEGGNWADKR